MEITLQSKQTKKQLDGILKFGGWIFEYKGQWLPVTKANNGTWRTCYNKKWYQTPQPKKK